MKRLVVFDVDGTLVRGRLLTHVLVRAVWRRELKVRHTGRLFRTLLALGTKKIPQTLSRALRFQDFEDYDLKLRHCVNQLLLAVEEVVKASGQTVQGLAESVLTQDMLASLVHPAGINALQKRVSNSKNRVVLLSASPVDVLKPFKQWLRTELGHVADSLEVCGTILNGAQTTANVGAVKLEVMKRLHGKFTIDHLYTDNGSMADLPLIRVARRTTIIGAKHRGYSCVPRRWLRKTLFCFD